MFLCVQIYIGDVERNSHLINLKSSISLISHVNHQQQSPAQTSSLSQIVCYLLVVNCLPCFAYASLLLVLMLISLCLCFPHSRISFSDGGGFCYHGPYCKLTFLVSCSCLALELRNVESTLNSNLNHPSILFHLPVSRLLGGSVTIGGGVG